MRRLLPTVALVAVATLLAGCAAPAQPVVPPPAEDPTSIAGDWIITRTVVSSEQDPSLVGSQEVRYLVFGDGSCEDGVCTGPMASSNTDGIFVEGSADALAAVTGAYTWDGKFLDYTLDGRSGLDCVGDDGSVTVPLAYGLDYVFQFSADGDGFTGTVVLTVSPAVSDDELAAAGCPRGDYVTTYDAVIAPA